LNYKGQGDDDTRFFLNLTPVEEIRKLMGNKDITNQEGVLPDLVGK
jgi:hypothetical protein